MHMNLQFLNNVAISFNMVSSLISTTLAFYGLITLLKSPENVFIIDYTITLLPSALATSNTDHATLLWAVSVGSVMSIGECFNDLTLQRPVIAYYGHNQPEHWRRRRRTQVQWW